MDEEMETSSALATMEVEKPRKLVIFAWSGDLDRVCPQLKNDRKHGRKRRLTGENWMQKLLSSMNHGGTEHLKLGKMNFAGAGPRMFGKLARQHKVASPTELMEMAQEMGVHMVPCQMTMDLMGLTRDDLIDGLEEPAGATTALLEAQDAVTLFV